MHMKHYFSMFFPRGNCFGNWNTRLLSALCCCSPVLWASFVVFLVLNVDGKQIVNFFLNYFLSNLPFCSWIFNWLICFIFRMACYVLGILNSCHCKYSVLCTKFVDWLRWRVPIAYDTCELYLGSTQNWTQSIRIFSVHLYWTWISSWILVQYYESLPPKLGVASHFFSQLCLVSHFFASFDLWIYFWII